MSISWARSAYVANADVVETLFSLLDFKDSYTARHSERVAEYAIGLATYFELPDFEIHRIYYGSLLHDIGKILVPDEILFKTGELNTDEYNQMKCHTILGCEIVNRVRGNRALLPIIRSHHERLDGKGYPDKLHSNQILFAPKIVSIADAFDAMMSNRVYRDSLGLEKSVEELIAGRGTQFDPYCVDMFISNVIPKFFPGVQKELKLRCFPLIEN